MYVITFLYNILLFQFQKHFFDKGLHITLHFSKSLRHYHLNFLLKESVKVFEQKCGKYFFQSNCCLGN